MTRSRLCEAAAMQRPLVREMDIEYDRFSDELAAYARQDEEIFYPAALLVGHYVALAAPAH